MGIMPYAGISFFTYESLKKLYSDVFHENKLNPLHRLLFGACAGLFGQSATYPLDIIRRRMQTDGITSPSRPEYKRMWTTAKYVYATEGLRKGLYKGLSMNWVKGPIAVGMSFTTFDMLYGYIQRHYIHTKTGWEETNPSTYLYAQWLSENEEQLIWDEPVNEDVSMLLVSQKLITDRKLLSWYTKHSCNFFSSWWLLHMTGIKGDVHVHVDFVIEAIYSLELLCYPKPWLRVAYYDGILIAHWNTFFFKRWQCIPE